MLNHAVFSSSYSKCFSLNERNIQTLPNTYLYSFFWKMVNHFNMFLYVLIRDVMCSGPNSSKWLKKNDKIFNIYLCFSIILSTTVYAIEKRNVNIYLIISELELSTDYPSLYRQRLPTRHDVRGHSEKIISQTVFLRIVNLSPNHTKRCQSIPSHLEPCFLSSSYLPWFRCAWFIASTSVSR